MRIRRTALFAALILVLSTFLSGCWGYKEIDDLAVVAGVAIDKGVNEKFSITVEIVEAGYGMEAEPAPKILSAEGKTIFAAVRDMVAFLGKNLYWSHTKVVIISRSLAEEGVLQVLDWFNRDTETRSDIKVIISKEQTAREVLASQGITEKVVSFDIEEAIDNQKRLHHAPDIMLWEFTTNMQSEGTTAVATAISLKQSGGQKHPSADGTAIFGGDRLKGFIDSIDTMSMLFVLDEIEGGVLAVTVENGGEDTKVSLEIEKNKTKVKPVINNGVIGMDINIETDVVIDEIETSENLIKGDGLKRLEASAENMLKRQIEGIIRKAQKEYGTDMFGFGDKLRRENPSAWKTIGQDWSTVFKDVKVNVVTKVQVVDSAMLSKTLKVGY